MQKGGAESKTKKKADLKRKTKRYVTKLTWRCFCMLRVRWAYIYGVYHYYKFELFRFVVNETEIYYLLCYRCYFIIPCLQLIYRRLMTILIKGLGIVC